MEPILLSARSIALSAAFVACVCTIAAVPMLALGNDDATAPTVPPVSEELLEARANVEEINATALEEAPPSVGAGCGRTLDVEGLGPTCVTPDNLLRVESEDGTVSTTHGLDAPPIVANSISKMSQGQVNRASADSVTCAAPGERGYVLVYARPLDVTSRYDQIAPLLREETYKMSAYIDAESQSVDPRQGKRIPMRCEGGTPVVLNATIPAVGGVGIEFGALVQHLRALGYSYNSFSSTDRYIAYVDAPSTAGAAGTAHIFDDPTPTQTNSNNKGGTYAIEYRWAQGGGVPHWDVLMHEVIHTMGGVASAAPNSSGVKAGHCNDGLDVMCYADGGNRSNYNAGVCTTKMLDCGRNDYFNPAPPAGTYLASNWNVAHANNLWLEHRQTGDLIAPTAPAGLGQTGASNAAIGVTWQPAADNVAVTGYTVRIRPAGGGWRDVATTTRRSLSIGGLAPNAQHEVSVTARDAAGNVGPEAVVAAATNNVRDRTAPGRPSGLKVSKSTLKEATFVWREASDNVGVAQYELRLVVPAKKGSKARAPRSLGGTPDIIKTVSLRGLKAGSKQRIELVARDAAGNISRGTAFTFTVPKDRTRPTAPGSAKSTTITSRTATLTWSPSTDVNGSGVKSYVVFYKAGRTWKQFGSSSLRANTTKVKLNSLQPRTTYQFRIHARDAANNLSKASTVITVRTR